MRVVQLRDHARRSWVIARMERTPITTGQSGATVSRLGAPGQPMRYEKRGTDHVAQAITAEAERLRWLEGRVPAPAVVSLSQQGAETILVTTALPGRSAFDVLEHASPEARVPVVEALAAFLRQLHALPVDECPFDATHPVRLVEARRNVDAGLVDESDFDPEREGWMAAQVWDALQGMLPIDVQRVVTHGDFSLDNVFVDDAGQVTGCLDVGRMGVADPYQDLAILSNCLSDFDDPRLQVALFASYGIDTPDERRIRFHLLLDELF